MRFKVAYLIILMATACGQSKESGKDWIERSIEAHGGEAFEKSSFEFEFRDATYIRIRSNGKYTFVKRFQKEGQSFEDSLSNSGFKRYKNGALMPMDEEWKDKYAASLNSVIYFAFMPFRLRDEAVIPKFLSFAEIKGEQYAKIKVTFKEEGGGEDFDDVFVFWINTQTDMLDYLAYSYAEEKGRGFRFRQYRNRRNVDGMVFQDYDNYEYKKAGLEDPADMDELFKREKLNKLSEIDLVDIRRLD